MRRVAKNAKAAEEKNGPAEKALKPPNKMTGSVPLRQAQGERAVRGEREEP
jgi:hypothetical protein